MTPTLLALALAVTNCTATDGDTIRCGKLKIRPLGIDAPEMPGHCRRGRKCAPGNPFASRASMRAALKTGPVTITRTFGRDKYGRLLALVSAGRTDVSCWQLTSGQAIYKPNWDNGGALAAICAAAR